MNGCAIDGPDCTILAWNTPIGGPLEYSNYLPPTREREIMRLNPLTLMLRVRARLKGSQASLVIEVYGQSVRAPSCTSTHLPLRGLSLTQLSFTYTTTCILPLMQKMPKAGSTAPDIKQDSDTESKPNLSEIPPLPSQATSPPTHPPAQPANLTLSWKSRSRFENITLQAGDAVNLRSWNGEIALQANSEPLRERRSVLASFP